MLLALVLVVEMIFLVVFKVVVVLVVMVVVVVMVVRFLLNTFLQIYIFHILQCRIYVHIQMYVVVFKWWLFTFAVTMNCNDEVVE